MLNYSIYKKNKESGVAWLGMIPEDWQVNRLANLCRFEKGYGLSKGDLDVNGEFPCVLYGELYTKYKNSNVIDLVSSRTRVKSGYRSVGDEILIPGSTTTTGIDLANAKYLL